MRSPRGKRKPKRIKLSPSGLPWPEGWSRPWANGWVRDLGGYGIGALIVTMGVSELISPAEPGWATRYFLLLVGIGCLLVPPWFGIARGRARAVIGTVPGQENGQSGIVFRVRRSVPFAMSGSLAFWGVALVLPFLEETTAEGTGWALFFGILLLLISPIPAIAMSGFKGVILAPDFVVFSVAYGIPVRASWQDIEQLDARGLSQGTPSIRVSLRDATVLGNSRWAQRIQRRYSRRATRFYILPSAFQTDPALLRWVLRHYRFHPERRHELGTQLALDRIAEGQLDFGAHAYGLLRNSE
ncbi:hypothetical protein ACFQ07_28255 [Actinomadura adrarensis]|uniref:RDD family protein n=1 Tax=Actinomadura adrarensis TaxID=1819600 RepID=A0ABW3CPH8_9ACTN